MFTRSGISSKLHSISHPEQTLRTSPQASPHLLKLWEPPPPLPHPPMRSLEGSAGNQLPPNSTQTKFQQRLVGAARAHLAIPQPFRTPRLWRPLAENLSPVRKDWENARPPAASPHLLTSLISSFIQLRRSAVPSGSRGSGVRGSAAGAGRGESHAASPAGEEAGSRRGRREGRGAVQSRGADWPWPPMCLCLCGSVCRCQQAPKVCARQRASAARGPIAEPPRSPDSWPALALVYFRPDVTTGADFKVGTVLRSPW